MPAEILPLPRIYGLTVEQKFWRYALKSDACWSWLGGYADTGYALVYENGKTLYAHRISYRIANGEIPDGLVIDHLCRNRGCVNPAHLEAVTQRENVMRGLAPQVVGNRQRSKTHCPRGHEYSGSNLYVKTNGFRSCRACQRILQAAARARKAEREDL